MARMYLCTPSESLTSSERYHKVTSPISREGKRERNRRPSLPVAVAASRCRCRSPSLPVAVAVAALSIVSNFFTVAVERERKRNSCSSPSTSPHSSPRQLASRQLASQSTRLPVAAAVAVVEATPLRFDLAFVCSLSGFCMLIG
ncbi:hypothetical protein LWI29_005120 [Acer saccharum]|uniref:Uncharacterized protein n=1 Tax=Acer saccharum TaxID=4024 RepID=A0AA39VD41_ACESA|nr:hypothetical protein LWI29_005120 [Acer saccharum]